MRIHLRAWPVLQLVPFFLIPPATFGAEATLSGRVVDQSGQALPRAHVRVLIDADGRQHGDTLTDETGRFVLQIPTAACHIEASLLGFQRAVQPCAAPAREPVQLTLPVAPLQESVVVTATRTDVSAGQLGASVTAFSEQEIERRRVPLVTDLLRTSPGAMVVQSGAYGGVTSLFVRGGESNHNKVLLDGIPLNEPGGSFNLSNLSTDQLERVEIVRGAYSTLFGSDAMSSVVQLFTKKADRSTPRPRASVTVEGGSYGTIRGSVDVSGVRERFDYMFGAARYSTDNQAENNAFGNSTLSANVGYALTSQATLRGIVRGVFGQSGTPGPTAFGRPDLDASFSRDEGMGGMTFDHQATSRLHQRAAYSFAASRQRSTNLVEDPAFTPRYGMRTAPFVYSDFLYDSRTDLDRHHASYQADWRIASNTRTGDHLLTAVADWDGERATLRDFLDGSTTHATRDNFGWSVQHQASWPRLFLTVGGRIERNDSFGTSAVPRGSVVVVVRDQSGGIGQSRFRASAGLGIKEPTLLQSFSQSPFYLGNPDLEPERSRTIELGFNQRLAADRVRIDLAWFDNRFENLIATRITDFTLFQAQYFNVGRTRARGAELTGDVAVLASVQGRFGYTFLDSQILDSTAPGNPVFQQGAPLFRRPRHSGYVGITLAWQRLDLDLNGVVIGTFVDSDFVSLVPPIVEHGGYTTWNLRLAVNVAPAFDLVGSVDNLTRTEYMEPLGYPALGRAVRAGLRASF